MKSKEIIEAIPAELMKKRNVAFRNFLIGGAGLGIAFTEVLVSGFVYGPSLITTQVASLFLLSGVPAFPLISINLRRMEKYEKLLTGKITTYTAENTRPRGRFRFLLPDRFKRN